MFLSYVYKLDFQIALTAPRYTIYIQYSHSRNDIDTRARNQLACIFDRGEITAKQTRFRLGNNWKRRGRLGAIGTVM